VKSSSRARIVCFASAKGGSGKTVICASLAKFLSSLGKRVLLIDMDAATNGLTLLYLGEVNEARRLIATHKLVSQGMYEVPSGEIPTVLDLDDSTKLIPATYAMKQTEGMEQNRLRADLISTVSFYGDKFDYILLDAQSGSDIYAQVAFEIADETIVVSEFDPISAEGVERLRRLFPESLSYDRIWVLYNKILPEFIKSFTEILKVVRFLPPIPWDVDVVRAFAKRKLAIDVQRGNAFTLSIMQVAGGLFGEELKQQIDTWKNNKERAIREPVQEQLQEVEELAAITESKLIDSEYRLQDLRRRTRRVLYYFLVGVLTLLATYFSFSIIVSSVSILISLLLVPLIAAFGVSTAIFLQLSDRRWQERAKRLQGEINAMQARLGDLRDQRQKLYAMTSADLETVIRNRVRSSE